MREIDQNLTFTHYKEPLKQIPEGSGFGYYGAILMSKDFQKMQCHICGGLYDSVGAHATQAHKITNLQYKEKFQLARETALISEGFRFKLQQRTLAWLKTLTEEEKTALKQKARANYRRPQTRQPKIALETKNKRGTCPDQLLDKIKQVALKLGHTPSKKEFTEVCGTQRFTHLIYQVYGSWSKAVEMCGLKLKERKRSPGDPTKYSDEELLEYLAIFAQENNKIPTHTDFNRGLLPSYDNYIRRWGSIEKARQLAGVYDHIDPESPVTLLDGTQKTMSQLNFNKYGGKFLIKHA